VRWWRWRRFEKARVMEQPRLAVHEGESELVEEIRQVAVVEALGCWNLCQRWPWI
jgi:hypothetical protein